MTDPQPSAGAFLAATVPMVRTLNLEFPAVTAGRAVARLPDQAAFHNHLGGPHAGALFTLAESASGAVVLASFGEQLSRAVPLAVRAEISYVKLARGPVTATAVLGHPAAGIVAELDAGHRPEFPVTVVIRREDGDGDGEEGVVTAEMTVVWTLRPHDSGARPVRDAIG